MLTPEQQTWVDHLSDVDTIKIVPFNPDTDRIFEEIKIQIQSILGNNVEVLHRGATGLGISGQSEIDIYIPVSNENIESMAVEMEKVFRKPKSIYLGERTKFIKFIDQTKLEIMLVNESCKSWIDGEQFNEYLKQHSDALAQYKTLKEEANGLTIREYYRRKIEFINTILKT